MTDFVLRQTGLFRPRSRWMLAAALFVLGAALAIAAVLHGYQVVGPSYSCLGIRPCRELQRPGWVDPAAFGVCLLGFAGATGLLFMNRRRNS